MCLHTVDLQGLNTNSDTYYVTHVYRVLLHGAGPLSNRKEKIY